LPEIQVKDKLITLEELGTAYNNTVKKSGDTMTGPLTAPNMVVRSSNWQFYYMQDVNGAEIGHMRSDEANHNIAFREYTPGLNNNYEDYYLPGPTGAACYYILTTKSPVGIPQGGTGATAPAGARNNIGIHTINKVVQTDSNGKFTISFQEAGVTNTPNVCLLQNCGTPNNIIIKYMIYDSSSTIIFVATWANTSDIIANAYIGVQGIIIE
jgi:hypothetical protein